MYDPMKVIDRLSHNLDSANYALGQYSALVEAMAYRVTDADDKVEFLKRSTEILKEYVDAKNKTYEIV